MDNRKEQIEFSMFMNNSGQKAQRVFIGPSVMIVAGSGDEYLIKDGYKCCLERIEALIFNLLKPDFSTKTEPSLDRVK